MVARNIIKEGLDKWFKEKWVDISRKGEDGSHPECGASSDRESRKKDHRKAYPKCVPKAKAKKMTKKEKESASRRKRKAEKNTSKSSKKPTYVKTKKNEMAENDELMGALMDSYGDGIPTVSGTAVFFDRTPKYRKHIPKIGDFYKNASNLWYQNKGIGMGHNDMPKCVRDNADYIAEIQAMRVNPLGEGCGADEAVDMAENDDISLKEGYYPIELAEDVIRRRIMGPDYEPEKLEEAEYKGKKVKLNKPKRGGSKKFYVYVNSGEKTKDGKIKAKKVSFGSDSMEIRRDDPDARKNFRARHNCSDKKDRKTAGYWSCKMWQAGKSVGDMLETYLSGGWNTSYLLTENAEKVWSKYYKDSMDFDKFVQIIKMDPTTKDKSGVNPKNGKYVENYKMGFFSRALVDSYIEGSMDLADISYATPLLDEIRKDSDGRPPNLPKTVNLSDIEQIRDKVVGDKNAKLKVKDEERDILYEDSEWLLVKPNTMEASCKYGANTKWCTAANNDNAFSEYDEYLNLYILINKRNKYPKYQLGVNDTLDDFMFMDEKDNVVRYEVAVKIYETLPDELKEILNSLIVKNIDSSEYDSFIDNVTNERYIKNINYELQYLYKYGLFSVLDDLNKKDYHINLIAEIFNKLSLTHKDYLKLAEKIGGNYSGEDISKLDLTNKNNNKFFYDNLFKEFNVDIYKKIDKLELPSKSKYYEVLKDNILDYVNMNKNDPPFLKISSIYEFMENWYYIENESMAGILIKSVEDSIRKML